MKSGDFAVDTRADEGSVAFARTKAVVEMSIVQYVRRIYKRTKYLSLKKACKVSPRMQLSRYNSSSCCSLVASDKTSLRIGT